jgi:hypothetical protein
MCSCVQHTYLSILKSSEGLECDGAIMRGGGKPMEEQQGGIADVSVLTDSELLRFDQL